MPITKTETKKLVALKSQFDLIHSTFSDQKFIAALDLIKDDPQARAQASKNIAAYLKQQGIAIPAGATVGLKIIGTNMSVCIHICVSRAWGRFCLHWSTESGFGVGACGE